MDTEEQAGMKGYELTVKKNVPLVIMEPIKGGLLANLPEEVQVKDNLSTFTDFKELDAKEQKAACCIKCGKCETVCPQKLPIRQDLERVQNDFDGLVKDLA